MVLSCVSVFTIRDCFGCLLVLLLFYFVQCSVDLLNISLWTLTMLHIGLILATPPLKKRNSVTIIVFNIFFEGLPHLCTHYTIICKVPQSSSKFQTDIQPQRPGRFSNASQRRAPVGRWVKKKADIEYPFEHSEVSNYTFDGVSLDPVTIKNRRPS